MKSPIESEPELVALRPLQTLRAVLANEILAMIDCALVAGVVDHTRVLDQHIALLARLPGPRERLGTELQLLTRTTLDDLSHVDSRDGLLPLDVPHSPAQPTEAPVLIARD